MKGWLDALPVCVAFIQITMSSTGVAAGSGSGAGVGDSAPLCDSFSSGARTNAAASFQPSGFAPSATSPAAISTTCHRPWSAFKQAPNEVRKKDSNAFGYISTTLGAWLEKANLFWESGADIAKSVVAGGRGHRDRACSMARAHRQRLGIEVVRGGRRLTSML